MKIFNDVESIVKELRPGSFFRLGYKTEVPVKAEFKDQYIVYKFVETTVRTGVSYKSLIKDTKVEKKKGTKHHFYTWSLKNKIRKHIEKDIKYLTVARMNNGGNTISMYVCINKKNGSTSIFDCKEFKDSTFSNMIRPSYFNKTTDDRNNKFFNVNIDNINYIYNCNMEYRKCAQMNTAGVSYERK